MGCQHPNPVFDEAGFRVMSYDSVSPELVMAGFAQEYNQTRVFRGRVFIPTEQLHSLLLSKKTFDEVQPRLESLYVLLDLTRICATAGSVYHA